MNGRTFLQALLDSKKLNPHSLALKMDRITLQSGIQRYLDGTTKEPRRSTFGPVAEFFGVELDGFYNPSVAKNELLRLGLLKKNDEAIFLHREKSNVSEIERRAKVPLISLIQAGTLTELNDLFHPGMAAHWVEPLYTTPSNQAYALKVEGDSMESPVPGALSFLDGSILIVDPNAATGPNDYVIAKDVTTQRATFKKLTTDGARWYLKPLNPAYPTIEIDDPSLRVIGKVVEFQPPGRKL